MHLPLCLAIAPFKREARFHRIVIFFESTGKTLEFADSLFFHASKPSIKLLTLSLSQHSCELLDQLIGLSNFSILLAELGEIGLLPIQALLLLKSHPMSHLASCRRTLGLHLLPVDHSCSLRLDRFEAPSLAFL